MLSVVALAALVGGALLTVQAADEDAGVDGDTLNNAALVVDTTYGDFIGEGIGGMGFGRRGFRGWLKSGPMGEAEGFGAVELSEEFEQKVTNIAESDTDVQDLLDEGYTISTIRPVIKRAIDADGYVATKATNAIMLLQKEDTSGASGSASVSIDIDAGKVTQVIILTRTVIDKS